VAIDIDRVVACGARFDARETLDVTEEGVRHRAWCLTPESCGQLDRAAR